MARISKETYGKILEQLGYAQHPQNKNLYMMTVRNTQYLVDLKGYEPVVFKKGDGIERITDPEDSIISNTTSVLLAGKIPTERSGPIDPEVDQEYIRSIPENSEDETADSQTIGGDSPSGMTVDCPDDPEEDEFINEEPPMEVIDPVVEEPEVKKPAEVAAIPDDVQVFHSIQTMDLQLAEAGKIKIGKKRELKPGEDPNAFRAPTKLDHFIVTTTEYDKKTGDLKLDDRIMSKLEPNCRRLRISFPYDDINLNFQSSFARYTKTKCLCRGDGKYARTHEGQVITCNPETCGFGRNGANTCKPSAILSVLLEDVPGIGGVYKFRTTSWNSIRNIYSSLIFITSKITGGILAGIPLDLVLIPKTVQIPGGKGTTEIYMVNIEMPRTISELRQLAKDEARMRAETLIDIRSMETEAARRLAAPVPVEPEEVTEYTKEFHPELYQEA